MHILKFVHRRNSWEYTRMADEIIKELWQIKDGIASEHGYDIKAFVAYLRARKHLGEHQVVDLQSAKKNAQQGAAPGNVEGA